MLFRRRPPTADPAVAGVDLEAIVRAHLPDADETTRALVTSIAGLLACVAFADHVYTEQERSHVREVVSRIEGLSGEGVDAICAVLDDHGQHIATGNAQRFTRALRDGCERSLRLEVLDALVDLAAADGALALAETDLLRRTAGALGLSQDDYVTAQARYRERLSVLK